MKTVVSIVLACMALTACGGDDSASPSAGTGSGASNDGGTGGTGGSGGGTLTLRYEALPAASDAASFLTLVNGEGAKGYRYLSDTYYADERATRSIFVSDGAAPTYTYQLQPAQADLAGLLNQANAQGAAGYRYEGPLTYGDLYRKDGGTSATYTYVTAALPADPAAFVTQANGQGQAGFWLVGPVMAGSGQANLYMKNNASGATYAYDALTPPGNVNDFVAQANGEGAKGYRAKGAMMFGTSAAWVYVKDQTQSSTFAYQSVENQMTSAGFVQQANDLGAQANAHLGELAFTVPPTAAMQIGSFYFKAGNCTGFLCTTLNPLTQN
ncbi:hypothetical protein C7H84_06715 [Burkholderia sp. Nafp2/4-1b]|uniref:hypothetical protein n=1 Tax=Burkholderia sp. Nafp2/4-1b TaxID=2116686 RepID=UPI000EF8D00B|nr:hypothetical protein [Burkholderia sp. Nafp2/4-1b]RKU03947.1 hypothetical protein C7H84_06715 [Burkholderia sp. Nafp2/4-1b]